MAHYRREIFFDIFQREDEKLFQAKASDFILGLFYCKDLNYVSRC